MACRNGGVLSIPGVYGGLVDKIPFGSLMNRAITVKTGQTHVQRYMRPLLERIQSGEIDPSFVVTHTGGLNSAAEAFQIFCDKQVALQPYRPFSARRPFRTVFSPQIQNPSDFRRW